MLAALTAACNGVTFPPPATDRPFRLAETVDATGYGAISPLDGPTHVPLDDVEPSGAEPLAVVEAGGRTRAYPLSILVWHEAVNDSIGDVPVLISYSPLTDSVTAWVRRADAVTYAFVSSGKVYAASGLLADRQTRSLWLPSLGLAVAGQRSGEKLAALPVVLMPASAYRVAVPDGTVLSPETGLSRPYGRSPYRGYAGRTAPPRRLFLRDPDPRLPAMSHVLAVPGDPVYPFDAIRRAGVINDGAIAVMWIPGVASALDTEIIARARDTGSAAAFLSDLEGRRLTFEPAGDGQFRDRQTGTIWNTLGRAVRGPLAGRSLQPLAAVRSLWFAWAAVDPDAQVYGQGSGG